MCFIVVLLLLSVFLFSNEYYTICLYTGAWEPGGSGGVGPPLESGIYVVKKFLKFFSYLFGPPLDKNRSQAPAQAHKQSSIN